MEKEQDLTLSRESILNSINLREAKAAEFVAMIKDTNVEKWDLDLIWRVYDLMHSSCSVRFSLGGVYQMGYICGIRAERERRSGGRAL